MKTAKCHALQDANLQQILALRFSSELWTRKNIHTHGVRVQHQPIKNETNE